MGLTIAPSYKAPCLNVLSGMTSFINISFTFRIRNCVHSFHIFLSPYEARSSCDLITRHNKRNMSENGNFSTSRSTPSNCWQYQHRWSHPEQSKVYTCMCRHSTLILLCLTNHSASPPLHTRPAKLSPAFPRPRSGLRDRCSLSVSSITGCPFYTKSSQHFMRFAFKLLTLSLNISHRTAAVRPQTSPEKYPSLKVRPEQPNTFTVSPAWF